MHTHHKLDRGWRFRRLVGPETPAAGDGWCDVDLPHGAFIPDLDGRDHWCGICEYKRTVELPEISSGGVVALFVGGAMHTAQVSVDGRELACHRGGYLPFEVDLTEAFRGRQSIAVTLRLDNRNAPDVPPGKPLEDLDFCWYGGLYRGVELRIRPAVHITDPISASVVAGGGVFLRTEVLTPTLARVAAQVHVRDASTRQTRARVVVELLDRSVVVARSEAPLEFGPTGDGTAMLMLSINHPRTWSPDSPVLHTARVTVLDVAGAVLDCYEERFGVRRIVFSRSGGFQINGHRLRLRGTNRHQEHPYVGYAVSRAAEYRDARRIKEAGFDYVRLSHYPQSPDFLDACDELGIVVMNAIPGWQFIGGPEFCDACEQHARDLIRRDRNHACVVLWELSLNETAMDETFMDRMHRVGHEEYPGDQMFTCGWMDRYDVYNHSRQHGCIHTWANGDKALVVAEYGDWEFYATTEGFDQKTGAGVLDRWSNSRHFRGEGERGLRQQAWNHTLALNDTLASPAVLDGQWAVFDYARGYDPVRAAVGVMDVFRLPKFSYWFYRSQRDATEGGAGWTGGPVVFIASHWTEASDLRVVVFSNVDEVELRLNARALGRARPARTWMTHQLPHPPFVFDLPRFEAGRLEAIGFIGGREVARHAIATPGAPARIDVALDGMRIEATAGEPDLLIAHARIVDGTGTLCIECDATLTFALEGDAILCGPTVVAAEAGIASVVVRVPAGAGAFTLRAHGERLVAGETTWVARAIEVDDVVVAS